jgi:hypothetical protein
LSGVCFFFAFYATPYFLLETQHYTAKFLTVGEFKNSNYKQQAYGTADSAANRAMVLEINGDARAYPITYITQSHVAGGELIGVKYFAEYDYVDMFIGGNASEINHLGILPDGAKLEKFRHINQMLWRVYQHFYPNSILHS